MNTIYFDWPQNGQIFFFFASSLKKTFRKWIYSYVLRYFDKYIYTIHIKYIKHLYGIWDEDIGKDICEKIGWEKM